MKIAWLCPYPVERIPGIDNRLDDLSIKSHSSSWIFNLADELKCKSGIELHVITTSARIKNPLEINSGIIFHVIPSGIPFIARGYPSVFPWDRITSFRGLTKKILKIIDRIQPDILHAHGTEGVYGYAAVSSAVKSIISIQGIVHYLRFYDPGLSSLLQSHIEKYTVKNGENFGCRTDWDRSFVKMSNLSAKIYSLPEALNRVFFQTEWCGQKSNETLLVGTICERKGSEFIISNLPDMLSLYPELKFNFVGSGKPNYLEYLKNLSIKYGIFNSVNWVGEKQQSEIAHMLGNSRLYLHPSLIDNSPNSLLEAMAVGVPSLASAVGGIPSMINGAGNVLLFDINDKNDFIEKFNKILSENKFSSEAAEKSKRFVMKNNHPEKVADETISVYNQILSN